MTANELLPKVKENLVLTFNDDDRLITGYIISAIAYAEGYQHRESGYYLTNEMNATTEQAVIMLASHFYESRDGSTGGFFANGVSSVGNVWATVNRLLILERDWKV